MKQHSMISQSIKSLKALLALSALLITSPSFAQNSTDNHINNAKSATYDYATGQGLLTLESYVDGEIVDEHFTNPMNFVMVLDVSNSMCPFNKGDNGKYETVNSRVYLFGGDKIGYLHQGTEATNDVSTATNYTTNHNWQTTITIDGKTTLRYTIKLDGDDNLYNLAYFNNTSGRTGWYYSSGTSTGSGSSWTKYTANSANDEIYTDVKLDLLENACRQLIDVIYANPPKSGSHKISIVTYAKSGSPVLNVGLTAVTASTVGTLKDDVTHMTTAGDTYAKVGLDQAINNLNGISNNKFILFLTDGEPNNKYADILGSAKTLKDGGAKIYSIALVEDDLMNAGKWNGEQASNTSIKTYLEAVSSLYPSAVSISNKGTKNTDGVAYYQHDTGANLVDAFKKAGQSFIGGAGIEDLDPAHGVYLKDQINTEYCVLADNTDASKIKTYTADCTGKSGGVLTFDDRVEVTNLTVTVNTTLQSVDVEGFDYSGNWCGYDAEHSKYHGKKLIITIPFKMKAPGNGEFNVAFTNTEDSSLYDGDGPVDGAKFPIPDVKFTEVTIQKYGLKAGDSAVYIIKKGDVEITRVILTGTDDDGSMVSIKLRILEPDVEYSVTETWWDYTYTQTSKDVTDNVFVFKSKKTSGMENEAEHRKVNDFN